jgi:hypothetical protein
MPETLTVTSSAMRAINRSAILDKIRREGPISRTAIAHQLGVSLPTVMRIVDGLVQEGFVRPLENKEWSGRDAVARVQHAKPSCPGIDRGDQMYGVGRSGRPRPDECQYRRHDSPAARVPASGSLIDRPPAA